MKFQRNIYAVLFFSPAFHWFGMEVRKNERMKLQKEKRKTKKTIARFHVHIKFSFINSYAVATAVIGHPPHHRAAPHLTVSNHFQFFMASSSQLHNFILLETKSFPKITVRPMEWHHSEKLKITFVVWSFAVVVVIVAIVVVVVVVVVVIVVESHDSNCFGKSYRINSWINKWTEKSEKNKKKQ